MNRAGIALQLLEPDAVAVDPRLDVAVGRARHADPHRARLAPWRGRRITRASSAKYLPPNWAPIPLLRAISITFASSSGSRNAWPSLFPSVGSVSRYPVLASLTVFIVASAEVPPITTAR